MAAPSSKHNKDPKAKIEMRSRLKYNLEDKMSLEQIGKGFEGNKDQINDDIMKIFQIFIPMIVSSSFSFFIQIYYFLIWVYNFFIWEISKFYLGHLKILFR